MTGGGQLIGRGVQRSLVDVGEHDRGTGRGEGADGVQAHAPVPAPVTRATWPLKS